MVEFLLVLSPWVLFYEISLFLLILSTFIFFSKKEISVFLNINGFIGIIGLKFILGILIPITLTELNRLNEQNIIIFIISCFIIWILSLRSKKEAFNLFDSFHHFPIITITFILILFSLIQFSPITDSSTLQHLEILSRRYLQDPPFSHNSFFKWNFFQDWWSYSYVVQIILNRSFNGIWLVNFQVLIFILLVFINLLKILSTSHIDRILYTIALLFSPVFWVDPTSIKTINPYLIYCGLFIFLFSFIFQKFKAQLQTQPTKLIHLVHFVFMSLILFQLAFNFILIFDPFYFNSFIKIMSDLVPIISPMNEHIAYSFCWIVDFILFSFILIYLQSFAKNIKISQIYLSIFLIVKIIFYFNIQYFQPILRDSKLFLIVTTYGILFFSLYYSRRLHKLYEFILLFTASFFIVSPYLLFTNKSESSIFPLTDINFNNNVALLVSSQKWIENSPFMLREDTFYQTTLILNHLVLNRFTLEELKNSAFIPQYLIINLNSDSDLTKSKQFKMDQILLEYSYVRIYDRSHFFLYQRINKKVLQTNFIDTNPPLVTTSCLIHKKQSCNKTWGIYPYFLTSDPLLLWILDNGKYSLVNFKKPTLINLKLNNFIGDHQCRITFTGTGNNLDLNLSSLYSEARKFGFIDFKRKSLNDWYVVSSGAYEINWSYDYLTLKAKENLKWLGLAIHPLTKLAHFQKDSSYLFDIQLETSESLSENLVSQSFDYTAQSIVPTEFNFKIKNGKFKNYLFFNNEQQTKDYFSIIKTNLTLGESVIFKRADAFNNCPEASIELKKIDNVQ